MMEFCVQVGPLAFMKQQNILSATFQCPRMTWALQVYRVFVFLPLSNPLPLISPVTPAETGLS